MLLDLSLNVHQCALEMSRDLPPLRLIFPQPLQTLLLQGEREKEREVGNQRKYVALSDESNLDLVVSRGVRWTAAIRSERMF